MERSLPRVFSSRKQGLRDHGVGFKNSARVPVSSVAVPISHSSASNALQAVNRNGHPSTCPSLRDSYYIGL